MRRLSLIFFSWALIFGVSCTQKSESASKQVNLAIWGNYLAPELQKKFTESTGIKINISNYSSNEELLAKLQSGAAQIDVAVPSDYMIEIMTKSGMLAPLDWAKIPNMKGINPQWLKMPYDPENKYSLPYAWTSTGIAVNRDLYKGVIRSWKDFFNANDLAGKISMLDDGREVIGAALKMQGFSINTTKPEELKKAKEQLMAMKSKIKMFRSDTIEALVGKEIAVAQAYSPDALQAAAAPGSKIEYVLPEEGTSLSTDNLVILKSAKNIEGAHSLINFMLSEEANLSFVKNVWGGPILKSTQSNLPVSIQKNTALFPPANQLAKMEKMKDLGVSTRLYDELWTEIKSK